MRLGKALARAGLCSRRKAEDWIRQGRVLVNGGVATEPWTMVDPDVDQIRVEGRPVPSAAPPVYFLLNKPRGVVTSLRDPQGRPTVATLLKGVKPRVFPVGRLDYETEGLLLLTNDGDLAERLLHPRYGLERAYMVKVKGIPTPEALQAMRRGIHIEPDVKARAQVRPQRVLKANAWLEMILHEGRHREVRRICEAVGHPVILLRRIRFGPLTLRGVPGGGYRPLSDEEIRTLRRLAFGRGGRAQRREVTGSVRESSGRTRTAHGPKRSSERH